VADAPIDLDGAFLEAWGVDFSGNVLLLGGKGQGPFTDNPSFARWLDPRGAPLTDWFAVGDVYYQNDWFVPVPGGLALMVAGECCGDFSLVFPSGEASAKPAPRWLFDRSPLRLHPIHGNALVALPTAHNGEPVLGPCGPQIEVLAADGTTCGCVPGTAQFGVGRDGSAITSGSVSGAPYSRCIQASSAERPRSPETAH